MHPGGTADHLQLSLHFILRLAARVQDQVLSSENQYENMEIMRIRNGK